MNEKAVEKVMRNCTLCPRNCGADRTTGTGVCGAGEQMVIARAALHFWEEPVISGSRGSGAVFFSGCNLGCVFCQNAAISHVSESKNNGAEDTHRYTDKKGANPQRNGENQPGKTVSIEKLAEIMLRLQNTEGANNINLVTAAHYAPQVAAALETAKVKGLTIPVVYNSSGYEKAETLRFFDGLVDVYLPDFKYATPELAAKLSKAPDYPAIATAALDEMVRQAGEAEFYTEEPFPMKTEVKQQLTESPAEGNYCSEAVEEQRLAEALTYEGKMADDMGTKDGKTGACRQGVYPPGGQLIRKGVIVRNLLLPGHVHESERVLSFLHERYGDSIYISIMNQYTPMPEFTAQLERQQEAGRGNPMDADLANLGRRVTKREYERLLDFAINIGIQNGFTQEGGTAKTSLIPSWNGEGVD